MNSEAVDLFSELFEDGVFRPDLYLFRGMGNADWKLEPTFDRRFSYLGPDQRLRVWDELIEQWRRGCAEHGHARDAAGPKLACRPVALWALGQHHGLPHPAAGLEHQPVHRGVLRLQQAREQLPHRFSHVALWVLHLDNPGLVPGPGRRDRLRARPGERPAAEPEREVHPVPHPVRQPGGVRDRYRFRVALTKVVLPAGEAVALPDLDSMGINSYHVYPDLGGLAEMATMRLLLSELTAQGR